MIGFNKNIVNSRSLRYEMYVKNTILSAFEELKELSDEEIVYSRMEKYAEMGVYKE